MRKRLLAILLTSVLLGLSACGNKTAEEIKEAGKVATEESIEATVSTQETEASQEATEATQETTVGTQESGEETASTEEEAGQEEQSEVTEDGDSGENAVEQSGEALLVWVESIYYLGPTMKSGILTIKEDTYPALAKVIEHFNDKQRENVKEQRERLAQMPEEDYPEDASTESDVIYEYIRDLYPVRADKEVLSVLNRDYFREGKSGERCCFEAVTVDVQSGNELTLGDIFKSGTDLTTILKTELQENHPTFTYDAQALAEENLIWTLGYKGVSVYLAGKDSDQPIQILVTYEEYPDIFNGDYLPDAYELLFEEPEGDYIRLLTNKKNNENVIVVDLYGDGKEDHIILRCENHSCKIMVNDNYCFYSDDYAYFDSVYLIRKDGKYFLYIDQYWDSDYECVDVFEITDHSVKYVDGTDVELVDFMDPHCFVVREYVYMFESRLMEYECYVGPDGMPVSYEEVYSIDREGKTIDYDYISLVEITAQLLDEEGNLLGTTYTFPAGTEFTFIRTDCKTYEDAKTGDGRYCRLYIDWPSEEEDEYYYYHPTVNGLDAETCFGPLHII